MNCTLLSSCPNDGSSNAPSDGWKSAEGSGKTANGNSIPAYSSFTLPSSSSYSEDREQALKLSQSIFGIDVDQIRIVILSEAKNPRIFLAAPRSIPLAKTL